jgi:pyruvate dehydrogenase E2 component (dihydrolipoamide acetyltransferase)
MADITMPKMGFDMTEGTIVKWLKKPGDDVKKGESIAEIETDKVTIEIEAFDSGTLSEIVVQEGQTAPVNSVIARLGGAGDARPAGEEATAAVGAGEGGEARPVEQAAGAGGTARVTQEAPTVQSAGTVSEQMPGALPTPSGNGHAPPPPQDNEVKASPLARRMAREAGVSLSQIQGSGPGGRVVRDDVTSFLGNRGAQPAAPAQAAQSAPAQQAPAPAAAPAPAEAPAPAQPAPAPAPAAGSTLVPLTSMRRTIAKRTTQNWQAIPHVFVTLDVDMGAALALRKQINEGLAKEAQISVNDMILKASAMALVAYPHVNVSYTDEGIQQHSAVNLSIAVALDAGLVAPVLMNAQDRSLGSIARDSKRLIGLVREGKLSQDILSGGTFQVSNLGMFGVSEFGSIISLPQAAALAVGATQRVPAFVGDTDEVVAKQIMKITVSADHRALDGAEAAKFGAEIKRLLENPLALLVG